MFYKTTWLVLLQNAKVIENKEGVRNRHSQEEPKETWQIHAMCYPSTEKRKDFR